MLHEKWTQRTFRFDTPPGRMPFLLERLRGTPARLEEKVRGVPADVLQRRDGRTWSAQENLGHLLDLEELHLARLDDFAAGLDTLRPVDLTNQRTWDAGHNETPLAQLLDAFRRARTRFVDRLAAWDPERIGQSALHPRLKVPMRVIDLAEFTAEHDDYHLARIELLISSFRKNPH